MSGYHSDSNAGSPAAALPGVWRDGVRAWADVRLL